MNRLEQVKNKAEATKYIADCAIGIVGAIDDAVEAVTTNYPGTNAAEVEAEVMKLAGLQFIPTPASKTPAKKAPVTPALPTRNTTTAPPAPAAIPAKVPENV